MPACGWDRAAQKVVDHNDMSLLGSTAEPIWPEPVGEGFVAWRTGRSVEPPHAPMDAVVLHCPTKSYLYVVFPPNGGSAKAAERKFEELVFGPREYTLRQIGQEIAMMGGGAREGLGDLGNCGCTETGLS